MGGDGSGVVFEYGVDAAEGEDGEAESRGIGYGFVQEVEELRATVVAEGVEARFGRCWNLQGRRLISAMYWSTAEWVSLSRCRRG